MKILLALFFLLSAQLSPAEVFFARVVGVQDGDSITVLTQAKQRIQVRLDGIDAPEMGQDFGRRAKEALSKLIFSRTIMLKPTSQDRYGRTIAVVYLGEQNINLEMIRLGLAWHYTQYNDDPLFQVAERFARERRIGLWSHNNPIPPWEWRRQRRNQSQFLDSNQRRRLRLLSPSSLSPRSVLANIECLPFEKRLRPDALLQTFING